MRGRKPTPTHLKVVRGNPGRRPLPAGEPKPEVLAPEPPSHLNARAIAEWNRVAPLLLAMNALCEIDRAALAAYCVAYARWADAEEQVARHGPIVKAPKSGVAMQNPFLSVANNAMALMERYSSKFGMSPQDRARLNVDVSNPAPDVADQYFA